METLPVELQDKIMDMKADLEEKDRFKEKLKRLAIMKRDWSDAMEEFLMTYGFYDQFRDEFMDGIEDNEKDEWKEWFGIEDEEGA